MLSSNDVSAMMAAQNQQFAGQNYYARTIGVMDPSMGLGAARGSGIGGFQPAGPSFPGIHGPPPVMNYGAGGFAGPGYGSGNRVAGNVMSGLGAAATLGGVGVGLASMFGPLRGVAPMIDPISGFLAHGPKIPLLNAAGTGTVMSGLAGAVPGLALGMAASHAVGSFIGGAHQQAGISNQLGNFNFINPQSRSGQGFSRQDASEIGGAIRSLSHVPDMMTSVEELTRLLPKMRSMGTMTGVRDAAEFNKRFKETVTTIRDMSRMLGTTMEEAAKFFEHSKLSGFSTKGAQLQNALNAQFTSGYTGMSMGETMGMQAGGAQIARQFGARGAFGARGVTSMAQKIQSGIEAGTIEQGLLEEVTGMSGPEAVGAASQKMYSFMQGLSQTSPGRLIMAGAMKRDEKGNVVLDDKILQKLNRGEISADDLKSNASKLSDNDKISFMYQAKNLGAQFAGSVDIGKFMQGLVGNKGQDAAAYMLQQYSGGQMSEADISMLMGMGKGSQGVDMDNFTKIRGREMAIREKTDPEMLWKRIKTKMHASTFGHIEQSGAEVYTAIGKAYDNFIDDLVGRHVIQLSKEGAKAFQQAMAGGGSKGLMDMFAAAGGYDKPGAGKAGSGGMANSDFMNWVRRTANPGTTGRTAIGQSDYFDKLVGVGGASRDAMMLKADAGGFVDAESSPAAVYLSRAKDALARKGKYGDSDDVRVDSLRSHMASTIGYAMYAKGIGSSAGGRSRNAVDIQNSLLSGNLEDAFGTKDYASIVKRLGGASTEAGAYVQAMINAKEKGLAIDDPLTGVLASTTQSEDSLKFSLFGAAGGSGVAAKAHTVAGRAQIRRDAEAGLADSGLSPESQANIRSNPKVRDLMNRAMAGKDEKLKSLIAKGDIAGIAEHTGITLSSQDLQAASTVLSDISNMSSETARGAAGRAIGAVHVSTQLEDLQVIKDRVGEAAAQISVGLGKREGAAGAAGQKLVASLKAFTTAGSEASGRVAFSAVRASMSDVAEQYQALRKTNPAEAEKFLEELGPAGSSIRAGLEMAKKVNVGMTKADLARQGFSEAEIAGMGGSFDAAGKLSGKIDSIRANAVNAVAGSRAALGMGVAGGSTDTDNDDGKQMVAALNKIQNNADKQTTLLAMLVGDKGGVDNFNKGKNALSLIRANGGDPSWGSQAGL